MEVFSINRHQIFSIDRHQIFHIFISIIINNNNANENMENLMTVVDRPDELQASSVGRRECSSTRQRTGARRMDVHVDT